MFFLSFLVTTLQLITSPPFPLPLQSPPALPTTPNYSFPPPPPQSKVSIPSRGFSLSSARESSIVSPETALSDEPLPDLILGEPTPSQLDDEPVHVFATALRKSSMSHQAPLAPSTQIVESSENEKSEQLLGPPRPREELIQQKEKVENEKAGLMGSTSRLHDELTEQLAQVSSQTRARRGKGRERVLTLLSIRFRSRCPRNFARMRFTFRTRSKPRSRCWSRALPCWSVSRVSGRFRGRD